MSSSTSRVSLYKPAGNENINVTTDLNNNWDKVDTNLGCRVAANAAARNAITPFWAGMLVRDTDTGSVYVSNGTPPISGSWTQVATAGASLSITGTNLLTLNGAVSTDNKLVGLQSGDSNNRFELCADGKMRWGTGGAGLDVVLSRTASSTIGTDSGDHLSVGGDLKLVNGTTIYRNKLSATTTVQTTTTETAIGTLTIPANDAKVGAIYRITCWGILSTTVTPTMTIAAKIGGTGGSALGTTNAVTTGSSITDQAFRAELNFSVTATGASGQGFGNLVVVHAFANDTMPATSPATIMDGGALVTWDTTASKDLVITAKWNTSSSSNNLRCYGATCERVA